MHISGLSLYSERVYKTPSFNKKDIRTGIYQLIACNEWREHGVFINILCCIKLISDRKGRRVL